MAARRAELPETLGRMLSLPLAFTGTETQVLTCWVPPLASTLTKTEVLTCWVRPFAFTETEF